jgi:hypothetical protein
MDAKFDAFGRELSPDPIPTEPPARDGPEIETLGKPSDLSPELPDDAPDAPKDTAPEKTVGMFPSDYDPEPPIEDHATPTRLEFLVLAERVTQLEATCARLQGRVQELSGPDLALLAP